MGTQQSSSGGLPVRLLGGAIYGVVAYVVSFVAVEALFLNEIRQNGADTPDITGIDGADKLPKLLGWVFYNAQTVDVTIRSTGGLAGTRQVGTWTFMREPFVSNPDLFMAVPAVLLFVAGYVVALRTPFHLDPVTSAVAGASVAIGYGALVVVGATYVEVSSATVVAGPPVRQSLLVAGLAYPVLCGGAGGFLRGLL